MSRNITNFNIVEGDGETFNVTTSVESFTVGVDSTESFIKTGSSSTINLIQEIFTVDQSETAFEAVPEDHNLSIVFPQVVERLINNIPPEDPPVYSKRVDFIDDDHYYIGEAIPGSSESLNVWRIRYVVIAVDGDVTTTWAGGSDAFNKAWTNRLSETYS